MTMLFRDYRLSHWFETTRSSLRGIPLVQRVVEACRCSASMAYVLVTDKDATGGLSQKPRKAMLRRSGIVYPSPDPEDVVMVLPRNLADVLQVWKGNDAWASNRSNDWPKKVR
jgi:hypothetical protein